MAEDLKDQEFGSLVVLRLGTAVRGKTGAIKQWKWHCRCVCGNETVVRADRLKSGHTESCGCLRATQCRANFLAHGESHSVDRKGSPEYRAWHEMRRRCYNENFKQFHDYGGRGIRVCDRWRDSYENFLNDMGRRPSPHHSLDRRNNDEHYTPDNCRWATSKEQNRNKVNNRRLEHDGLDLTLAEWAERTGLQSTTILRRLKLGWPVPTALSVPVQPTQITYEGQTRTLAEWSALTGVDYKVLWNRFQKGWPVVDILFKPTKSGRPVARA